MSSDRVGYTYFFREPRALDAALSLFSSNEVVSIWCAGVSTGEEAYSYSIMARERNLEATIIASDLEEQALAFARAGRYSDRALRRAGPRIKERWFQHDRESWVVVERARRGVRFLAHDVRQAPLEPPIGGFHIVSCRHLLIYLGKHEVEPVIEKFRSVLAPNGVLVLGLAERLGGSALSRIGFEVVHLEGASVYRRVEPKRIQETKARRIEVPGSQPAPSDGSARASQPITQPSRRSSAPPGQESRPSTAPSKRVQALRLQGDRALDRGDPTLALESYETALREAPLTADLHLRSALCALASGDAGTAKGRLRRALFLDPDCWPAALLLAELFRSTQDMSRYLIQAEQGMRALGGVTSEELAPFVTGQNAAAEWVRRMRKVASTVRS
ncbi:MAG: tetratricopeptide repeat protein [Deltaproteobacteria bacterium]|nr:tetratricopeptide repeat protein [Deltaproteobacteria bacterium]